MYNRVKYVAMHENANHHDMTEGYFTYLNYFLMLV